MAPEKSILFYYKHCLSKLRRRFSKTPPQNVYPAISF